MVGFKEEDFEGDFDASNHDNMMREIFDSEYYEEGGVGEEEKPEFSDSEEGEREHLCVCVFVCVCVCGCVTV